ncbi:MAG: GNAT family N-acetyltransferase [Chloroflexi bacterium]|nr:GNAT family N-acetyltransferase [Chloroflexota bacterium]
MMDIHPVTLEGRHVRLEPLTDHHAADLSAPGHDAEIFPYMPYGPFESEVEVLEWIRQTLAKAAKGDEVPFAIYHLASGRAIGSTRYMAIDRPNHVLEIGNTWLSRDFWRTSVNTECKFLLLSHAFESLDALRVQLKTDLRNVRSQNAIARLGAVREGILRKQIIAKGGYHRDTVMFSVIDAEWPVVKANLENKMSEEK